MKNDATEFTMPTGPLAYKLTNDYMFKAFLQRNEKALKGLLCALLSLKTEDIQSVDIMNPIELGETITDKLMILDIKIKLNNREIINLEMQVDNLGDWEERSLSYLCRAYDNLESGTNYKDVLKTVQIGILNFTPNNFPEKLYLKYNFRNEETGHIYSDKLTLFVLQLNQLGDKNDEAKMPELYYWAQLFRATTWEEIAMLADKNEDIKDSIVTLRQLTECDKIRMQCEARERYSRDLASATSYGMEQGIEIGYSQGVEKGYSQGVEKGYSQGVEKGYSQGVEKGYSQGVEKGYSQGVEKGYNQAMDELEDKMSKLCNILMTEENFDELKKATDDKEYRKELFVKYNL
ncbi:MAG: Rpn family recombination-promoting nuclease/putative transposase [Lachnospiraceae bacterium]|nr:Rpn family recombination-promoting nuclease/putative transposase [Lachnospiraceae bacterium]